MDFADILLNRMNSDNGLRRPIQALISFGDPEIGKHLSSLTVDLCKASADKSAITALYILDPQEAAEIENQEEYKSSLFSSLIAQSEQNKIRVRTFLLESENRVENILKTAVEQQCNLVMVGLEYDIFKSFIDKKYKTLDKLSENTFNEIYSQLQPDEAIALSNISSLLARNSVATGVFIDKGLENIQHIFVPILDIEDIHLFTYIYHLSLSQDLEIMIWDAIGITESNAKVQKIFQYIIKKADGRVKLWDNNKKIEPAFILQEHLVIVGLEGWEKLIGSSVSWIPSLPSLLIIKDRTS